MRFGILSQWYDPEPGGGAVPGVLANGLVERGHEVKVLTGFPNYPTGRVYPGYRQRWKHVESPRPRLTVKRTPLYASHDGNPLARSVNYLSFGATALIQSLDHLADRDALWVFNSPAPVGAVARQMARRRDVPVLVHVMDLWPDSVLDSGMLSHGRVHSLANHALGSVVRRTHEAASLVAVTSPGQIAALTERGVPSEKLRYIPVWANEEVFFPQESDRTCLPREARDADVVLMYAGSMGHVQRLDTLIRAVSHTGPAVQLVMAGTGVAESSLRALARDLRANNIHFMGPQPPGSMGRISAAADLHFVSLDDTPLMRMTMPSKVQSIMALGRPILATAAGDAAAVIEAAGAGLALSPGDEMGLRCALAQLGSSPEQLLTWGQAARAYYESQFSRTRALDRVERALLDISHGGAS